MRLPELALRHPVVVAVALIVILVFGVFSLVRLPVDLLPDLQVPVMVVVTVYRGADPLEIEETITRQVEDALAVTAGLRHMTSLSMYGASVVIARFDWGTPASEVRTELSYALDRLGMALPAEAEKPVLMEMDPTQQPVAVIGVRSELTDAELAWRLTDRIIPAIERVDGVARVLVAGAAREVVRVTYDPEALRQSEVPLEQLVQLLRYQNMNIPGGVVQDDGLVYQVEVAGRYQSFSDMASLIVGKKDSPKGQGLFGMMMPQLVRLEDVAAVERALVRPEGLVRVDGEPAVLLRVVRRADANVVQLSERLHKALAELASEEPEVELYLAFDEAEFVWRSIRSAGSSGLIGGVLAALILWFFLRSWRPTLAAAVAIPVSLLATFFFMYLGDISLNMISLGGLALSMGMLVDGAIVVLENIHRHHQEGKSPFEAANMGTSQVARAITGATLTTLTVFLPVIFIGGLPRMIFGEMAFTVCCALTASLFVALCVLPVIARYILSRPVRKEGQMWIRLRRRYRDFLVRILDRKTIFIPSVLLIIALAILVTYPKLGWEFLPAIDLGLLSVDIKLPPGTPLARTRQVAEEVEALAMGLPELERTITEGGGSGTEDALLLYSSLPENEARVTVILRPWGQRMRRISTVRQDLEERLQEVQQQYPMAQVRVNAVPPIGPTAELLKHVVTVQVRGPREDELAVVRDDLVERMEKSGMFAYIDISDEEQVPTVVLKVEKAKAVVAGLTAAQVGMAVRRALGETQMGTVVLDGRPIPLELIADPASRSNLKALTDLPLAGGTPGGDVLYTRLGKVTSTQKTGKRRLLHRQDGLRVLEVNAYPVRGVDSGSASEWVRQVIKTIEKPAGVEATIGGTTSIIRETLDDLWLALALAAVLVYLVMAAQFESFVIPLIIVSTLPLAAAGAAVALYLAGQTLSVVAMIGLVVLCGIVVNNGIVLIDQMEQRRLAGASLRAAVLEAAGLRLRPVLMTTATTALALLPLALGFGEATDLEVPLALAVIGGLVTATCLTLLAVPAVYELVWGGPSLKARAGLADEQSRESLPHGE